MKANAGIGIFRCTTCRLVVASLFTLAWSSPAFCGASGGRAKRSYPKGINDPNAEKRLSAIQKIKKQSDLQVAVVSAQYADINSRSYLWTD
jgi:hypothetical protein